MCDNSPMEKKESLSNKKIGPFSLFAPKKTTMKYGTYYDALMDLPFAKDKRHVRVWLPEGYDPKGEKRYPVMYMSDGQNLVDKYLTKFGDWHLDRVIHDLKEEGVVSPILVGVDCPTVDMARNNELGAPYVPTKWLVRHKLAGMKPIGDQFVNWVADELRPLIDSLFLTDTRLEMTGIGGSSMGGLMAWFAYLSRPDVFGFSLSFSPALFFYHKWKIKEISQEWGLSKDKHHRIFLYVGGKKFEHLFTGKVKWFYKYLKQNGFSDEQVALLVDKKQIHHEEPWSKYSHDALRFWLKGK